MKGVSVRRHCSRGFDGTSLMTNQRLSGLVRNESLFRYQKSGACRLGADPSYDHPMTPLFGEDLDIEALAPLLDAEPAQSTASPSGWGWRYYSQDLTKKQLADGPKSGTLVAG
jgi:hypothetical protein